MPEIVNAFLLGYITEWIYFLEDQFPHPSSDWSPKNHSIVKMDESRQLTEFELTYFIASVMLSSTNQRVKHSCESLPSSLGRSCMLFLKRSMDRNPSLLEPHSRSVASDLLQGSDCPNTSQLFWAQRMQFALHLTWQ